KAELERLKMVCLPAILPLMLSIHSLKLATFVRPTEVAGKQHHRSVPLCTFVSLDSGTVTTRACTRFRFGRNSLLACRTRGNCVALTPHRDGRDAGFCNA